MATGRQNFQTKDEYRKAKELDEARKAGTAPAELDEDGKEINPHIPQYIAQAPWYIDQGRPSLKHQRAVEKDKKNINQWYQRGQKKGPAAERFRKGACENCGAMTHKKKDCVERPRKFGAKFTEDNIQPDEVISNVELDYAGKHDRWNGYDPSQHFKLMETYQKIEEKRQKEKEKALLERKADDTKKDNEKDDDDDDDDDEFKDAHEVQTGQKFDVKTRTTIRNLRIREDTAKYLWNLDVNSAYYDPKTRSMRGNPLPNVDPKDLVYAGDNYVRMNGDALKFKEIERFAWDQNVMDKGVHLQGVPSQAELYHKQVKEKKEVLKGDLGNEIIAKYGGGQHAKGVNPELLFAQTEEYREYAPDGTVIKGQEVQATKSKYEEDIHPGNHKTVWGSYWYNGRWGYGCCHNLVKNSYCTGESGKENSEEARAKRLKEEEKKNGEEEKEGEKESDSESEKEEKKKKRRKEKKSKKRKHHSSSEEDSEDEGRKKKRVKKEHGGRGEDEMDERKRPYNSMHSVAEPTEKELENYHLTRKRFEDPMLNFKDSDSE
mmetsp:Transcript_9833/g.14881  ORF Transcript_9833/g.14881 Transcript_9833/m.14881 type:complete len:546 (-) Transcript_9833:1474-3111(-)|eukprot:CAMPEP_0201517890 /NCGR_PEP_ID=MMETSP0161_2-20130828/8875_1 /ASSEMBLY_ACC=CAM_ASM_000251 /TAXON_ID=180227 /ORGANISM="Neoparamoeba aestuarina, Strain SoJaBio B1-5/56/2" /LENGTH=545 /DNA_ID=CAMNT_0047915519 /DNA_START=48 /DNA_END=1685 /DNA_ORIENTATION=+